MILRLYWSELEMAHRNFSKFTRKSALLAVSFLTLFSTSAIYAQDYKRTVVDDPSMSRRCEELLEKRREKLAKKSRLLGLIERNQTLQKKTPEAKKSVKEKLEENLGLLKNELELTRVQIEIEEESIVRKGCPGIAL